MNFSPSFSAICYFTMFADDQGSLYARGTNNCGVLGRGKTEDGEEKSSDSVNQRCKTPEGVKVVSLGCGEYHVLALLEDSRVFTWGMMDSQTQKIFYEPQEVKMFFERKDERPVRVHCGGYFSAVITNYGSLYQWGNNEYSQLGLGDTHNRHVPTKVDLPDPVVDIATGWFHTIVVLKGGKFYSWGKNEDGKLGLGHRTQKDLPTYNPILTGVRRVYSGGHHSFALLEDGTLWGWGWNSHLNIGVDTGGCDVETPTKIMDEVVEAAGGWGQSIALREDGSVWTWGNSQTPSRTSLPATVSSIRGVGCIHANCFVVDDQGEIYVWNQLQGDTPKREEAEGVRKWQTPRRRSDEAWRSAYRWWWMGREDKGSVFRSLPVEILFHAVGLESF
jgi:alpha-tubulin suppressor-like RCC1 family protein